MANIALASEFIASAIISILVISNPVSTSAIFISLTNEMSSDEKMAIVKRAIKYSAGIMVFFSISGFLIFQIFGFSIGAFRIAGGVLLFSTAVSMLDPKPAHKAIENTSQDIALIPLSIPFTTGPGTIVTIVLLMTEGQNIISTHDLVTGTISIIGVYIGMSVTLVVSFFMMSRSDAIDARLKEGGRRVVTKIMGLLVMAIAVQFVINGIKDILPEFIEIARESSDIIVSIISYLPG